MAIPFNLPSDSDRQDNTPSSTEERLDQLLMDLYNLLRQILLRNHCDQTTDGATAPSMSRQVDGDVTSAASSPAAPACVCTCPCASSRRRPPRRHRTSRRRCCKDHTAPVTRRKDKEWSMIGEQLRRIAEEFKCTVKRKEEPKEQPVHHEQQICVPPKLRLEEKSPTSSNLFSLLVPAPSSLWTTVILVVGWRLFSRAR